jgi:hypothetical protein
MTNSTINTGSKRTFAERPEPLVNAALAVADAAVRTRAYELYEIGGRTDGRAEQDWYQAENDVRVSRKQA